MLAADAMAVMFFESGATHFFHVPVLSPQAMKKMVDLGMTPVVTHGEKAAAYMADGYARATGRPGLCGSQAIGSTNLAAGLRDAVLAKVPVVAITGGPEPVTSYKNVYQEIDDMPIFDRLTKFNAVVARGDRLPDLLRQAYRVATTGTPGPVHLELPGLFGVVTYEEIKDEIVFVQPQYSRVPAIRVAPDPDSLRAAAEALNGASRPILLVGGGVQRSEATNQVRRLIDATKLPVVSSLNGLGVIPEHHANWIGVVGDYSRDCANKALEAADVVLVVGSSLGSMTTRNYAIPRLETRILHVDINPEEIGRNFPNSLPLVGDALETLRALMDVLALSVSDQWLNQIAEWRDQFESTVLPLESSDDVPIRPERLWHSLSLALPENAVIVADTGHVGAWSARHLRLKPDQKFLRAAGSLGWGFPASLGAKCGVSDRPVVCLTGDAGFYYHLSELETARRYGINVVVVVNDNAGMNQEAHLWEHDSPEDKNWRFEELDFGAIAASFGCWGCVVTEPGEIENALAEALGANMPAVIDVKTDLHATAPAMWEEAETDPQGES